MVGRTFTYTGANVALARRWAFSSDCLNQDAALDFMRGHFRQGREDIEAGPLQEFDPTSSENVPCEILMAAPDSC